ncbi:FKBP-type peptidyl-prolyl cis-trans isomerase [Pedobacter sp. AW31-3R]|uniref:FKBP-type peptidyl-prolyl cis-trans isomerase n=1 Tax=Pedobacter sp. AW31-3R TaxID=3445781 RepID=UPI003FA0E8EF
MLKIKYFLLLAGMAACLASCKKGGDNFDAEAQFKADTTAIRTYIKANNINALKDANGVFYEIKTAGDGSISYTDRSKVSVTVNYTGKVMGSSSNFDSSNGTPRTFTLSQLIPGWQIGIPYIQKGGRIRLLIPSYYGYGNQASGAIPANSVLDFTIDLTNVAIIQ